MDDQEAKVVTGEAALEATATGGEAGAEEAQQFIPPEVQMLRPSAIHVQKFPDGSAQIECMISPFKVVGFGLPAEAVTALVRELTGGIEIASALPRMDIPRGRRPQ